jgi:LemA protein
VKFDEKINVMLANGKISAEQAETLKRSLMGAGSSVAENLNQHRSISSGILFGVSMAAVIGLVLYASVGGHSGADLPQEIQNVAETFNQLGKVGEMNKSSSTIMGTILLGLPVLISLVWFALGYNNLVSKEEDILVAWSQVESNYQRRTDLVPNLIHVVQTFTEHEGKTLTDIAKLRSRVEQIDAEKNKVKEISSGSVAKLEDETYMENLAKAQSGLGEQLKGLMVSVEAYPVLRSSDQYMALQAELEGTENRINVARMAFNEKVGEFNSAIRKLPGNLMASAGNFQRKAYFKSDEGSNKGIKANLSAPKTAE